MNNTYRYLAIVLILWLTGCSLKQLQPKTTTASQANIAAQHILITIKQEQFQRLPAPSIGRPYLVTNQYQIPQKISQTASALAQQYQLKRLEGWPIETLGIYCELFSVSAETDVEQLLATLQRDHRVESVQPLQSFYTESQAAPPPRAHPIQAITDRYYNDPYFPSQFPNGTEALVNAHQKSTGSGIKIAIIDTGADLQHPDLKQQIVVARNFVDTDSLAFHHDIHGTGIAGVIAARANNQQGIVGISPSAELAILKACWQLDSNQEKATCNSFTLAKAIAFAIDLRPQLMNLSLSGPADPLLTRLIQRAVEQGISVLAAAGSQPQSAFPARLPEVIAVRSQGQQYADSVNAPGNEILTTRPGGRYDFFTGSSLATAHASGVAALLLSRHPDLPPQQLRQLLNRSKHPNLPATLRPLLY